MEAVEFVESLRNIYIDASLLKKQGLSDEYIEHIKGSYIIRPKEQTIASSIFNVALFLEKRAVEEDLYENVELNIQMAEEFGDIAGGKPYYEFYKMMLGV